MTYFDGLTATIRYGLVLLAPYRRSSPPMTSFAIIIPFCGGSPLPRNPDRTSRSCSSDGDGAVVRKPSPLSLPETDETCLRALPHPSFRRSASGQCISSGSRCRSSFFDVSAQSKQSPPQFNCQKIVFAVTSMHLANFFFSANSKGGIDLIFRK